MKTVELRVFNIPTEKPRWADKRYDQLLNIRNPDCTACVLHKSTTNVCVMGRGNVYAPIHLIGEAPGEAESLTGLPFMGRAGQEILNPIIDELGMSEMVYISNVCRCRPPSNRKPTLAEMVECSARYLNREMDVIHPKVVVCMGKTASEWAFGKEIPSYGQLIPQPVSGQAWMRTWHPAYCLPGRGGKIYRNRLRDNLQLAKDFVWVDARHPVI